MQSCKPAAIAKRNKMQATFIYWFAIGPTLTVQLSDGASFGYRKRQQHLWPRKFKQCSGKMQSPIALSAANSIALPLPALEMIGFHDYLSYPLTLMNNGHSVTLNMAKNLNKRRLPYIFGAILNTNKQYELESLHFHWGIKNNRGSEHVINDIRYPMEMHIIHRNTAYTNLNDALIYPDGLVVLGIFFQLQTHDNTDLNPILKYLPSIQWVNTTVQLNTSITLSALIPKDTEIYYAYRGSLTTPPCSEAVTWIIFATPIPISFRQIAKFRMLSNGQHVISDNYRNLQNIGRRLVYVRKLTSTFVNVTDEFEFNITKYMWLWQ